MRRLRFIVCLVFAVSVALFSEYRIKARVLEDYTAPVITCDEDTVSVSVNDEDSALMDGITAMDNRDGDITESVRISAMSHFINGKRTVTYVVFDKANNIGTLQRTVEYTDYVPPRIYLVKPLRFSSTEKVEEVIGSCLKAEDCLDGDLTNQVRTIFDNSYYGSQAGIFPVTLQVSNSAGDVCSVETEMTITDASDREENSKQYPVLSEYIAYTQVNKKMKPSSYIVGLEMNGTEYTYEADGEMLEGIRESIGITSNVDYANPGVYIVEFSYTGEGVSTAVTKLYVVVEDE